MIKLYKISNKAEKMIELGEIIDDSDKGIFLSDMTEEEMNKFIEGELNGWNKIYDEVRKIINSTK